MDPITDLTIESKQVIVIIFVYDSKKNSFVLLQQRMSLLVVQNLNIQYASIAAISFPQDMAYQIKKS